MSAKGTFKLKTIMNNYCLIPTVALTGIACTMCAGYIIYMMKSKPDLHFRLLDKHELPEWSVGAGEYRKLFKSKKAEQKMKPFNVEVDNLRREIYEHYGQLIQEESAKPRGF